MDRPILLDPGGILSSHRFPELTELNVLISESCKSAETLPQLNHKDSQSLAGLYLAMTTNLILFIASGGESNVFGSLDHGVSDLIDEKQHRKEEVEEILQNVEVKRSSPNIERAKADLIPLFTTWLDDKSRRDTRSGSNTNAKECKKIKDLLPIICI